MCELGPGPLNSIIYKIVQLNDCSTLNLGVLDVSLSKQDFAGLPEKVSARKPKLATFFQILSHMSHEFLRFINKYSSIHIHQLSGLCIVKDFKHVRYLALVHLYTVSQNWRHQRQS